MPGMISSILLVVVGAIAKFAYSDTVWTWNSGGSAHSLRLDTVGVILMIAGAVAFIISALWNFFAVSPVEEDTFDTVVTKRPYEEPVKVVRRQKRKSR